MKRMGSNRSSSNTAAVALGRDMLKRPSKKNINEDGANEISAGGGLMPASVSMSALSHTSQTQKKRSERKMPTTLKDSFTLFLANEPHREINRMTEEIIAAMNEIKDRKRGNETFDEPSSESEDMGAMRVGRRRSNTIDNTEINMEWKGYTPVRRQRRGSRKGKEQVASMKLHASKILASLDDIPDISDGELDFDD